MDVIAPEVPLPSRWPVRLQELILRIQEGRPPADADRAEAWLLARGALLQFLRHRAGLLGRPPIEDLEDLASSKALEVLTRVEDGVWTPRGRHPNEVAGYLAAVARNGLIRLARSRGRYPEHRVTSVNGQITEPELEDQRSARPTAAAEASEFIVSLRECVAQLAPRSRRVWFFRAFYEMSSRDIASHPAVRLQPGHVDVLVQRTREALTTCMASKGHAPRDFPSGTFAELWRCMASMSEPPLSGEEDA